MIDEAAMSDAAVIAHGKVAMVRNSSEYVHFIVVYANVL